MPKIRKLHRVDLRIDSFFCDSELKVKLQELKIVAGHVAYQGQDNRLPRILRSQKLGPGSLRGAAEFAEQVQLKRRVAGESQKIGLGLEVIVFSAAEISVP